MAGLIPGFSSLLDESLKCGLSLYKLSFWWDVTHKHTHTHTHTHTNCQVYTRVIKISFESMDCACMQGIGLAPIAQLRTWVMKIADIQGKSPTGIVEIVSCIPYGTALKGKGSKFFPLKEVPILKKDVINDNHFSLQ